MCHRLGPAKSRVASCRDTPDAPTVGERKRRNLNSAEERELLAPFLGSAAAGGVLVVGQIKGSLQAPSPSHLTMALKTLEVDSNTVCSIVSWTWIIAARLNSLMN